MEAQGWLIYQPLIVGLGAVVIAAIGNTLVEWVRHILAERKEAIVLRRSLLLELGLVALYVKGAVKSLVNSGDGKISFPKQFPTLDLAMPSLGRLPHQEGHIVSRAYGNLLMLMEVLQVREPDYEGPTFRVITIKPDDRESVGKIADKTNDLIQKAIKTLERGTL